MKLLSKEIRGKIDYKDILVADILFSSSNSDRQIRVTAITSEEYIDDGGFSGNYFVEKSNNWLKKLILELENSDEAEFGENTNYVYRPDTELFRKQVKDSGVR